MKIVREVYRAFRKLLIGRPSKRLYKFMIQDWVRITDLEACSRVLETKRFVRNLQPLEMNYPEAKKILVIAPHPDDDILGAGGTLFKAIDNGAEVHVLYVTNGLPDRAEAIRQETLEVCRAINMTPHFLDCQVRRIPLNDKQVNRKFLSLINELKPDVIFTSFLLDDHDDHKRVNHLLLEILKDQPLPKLEIWAYQIYSSVIPNVVVNITEEVQKKKKLIHIWKSVGQFNDLAHYMLGINASNCRFLSAKNPIYVEAFFVVPLVEYLDLCRMYFVSTGVEVYYYNYYKREFRDNRAVRDVDKECEEAKNVQWI